MSDRIDAYCSMAHYAEHLLPILDALPDDLRGDLYAPRDVARQVERARDEVLPSPSPMPLIVAGYQDTVYGRRPKVLVNHGAGQRYLGVENASFAGGPGHEAVSLFICPNEFVAAAELDRYPRARVAVVGSPKLDAWQQIPKPHNDPPVVAVTFHWQQCMSTEDGKLLPESGWSWPTWRDTIADLARRSDVTVLGHGHPRAQRELRAYWDEIGAEFVPHAVDLLPRADVLLVDNSSLGFEWGALDRPTVWLAGEGWTDAEHGPPRFGGVPLPGPELGPWALRRGSAAALKELVSAINVSVTRFVLARMDCRQRIFNGMVDGHAAQRAADAVLSLVP